MSRSQEENSFGCPAQCKTCSPQGGGQGANADGGPGGLSRSEPRGWRLGWLSALLFLWPIAAAIIGAIVAPRFYLTEHSEAAGAAAGLVLGVTSSAVVAHFVSRTCKKSNEFDS
ncbi:MAG: hypothetical protein KAU28_08340 [Phycisphaerae bacterium]|nr:hypothetical protein [Phycisphaerae bacterium]